MTRYVVTTRRHGWPILRALALTFFLLGMFSYDVGVETASWIGAVVILAAIAAAITRSVRRSTRR